ncbi:MAG TPA: serine/threonine-protein kinase [Anaerolineae bacterium]|nr:serine/threonine-protein kinase [Anaerolineae bacterium]
MGGLTTRQLAGRRKRKSRKARRDQLQPGVTLQDRYRIVGVLGTGGFSSVYQARDLRFSNVTRLCAVKEMMNMSADPEVRDLTSQTFISEANALATLDHPAIPEVYDYFNEGERSYLVIEFIRGKDLEAMLSESDAPIPWTKALDWSLQLCDVLSYLHDHKPQPLIFRDLKPSNIMLDPHGRIRLIDFGIAKVFQHGEKGTMIGTEGYSPPEQYRGEASPAGDVYALGATLHHILTLQDPRMETPFTFADRPIHTINPDVPANFSNIVMRCLSYDVTERYSDAMSLQAALLQVSPSVAPGQQPMANIANVAAMSTPAAPPQQEQTIDAATTNDNTTGRHLWKFKCEDEIRSTPYVHKDFVFVGAYDNNLYALKRDTGEFAWKYPTTDGIASQPIVDENNVLYITSSDGVLYSLRMSGRVNWEFKSGGPIYSSPRILLNHIFFGSDDGFLYAINASSGRSIWKAEGSGPIRSSPAFSADNVFFGTETGYLFCLDFTGKLKWQFQAKRAITSSPAVSEEDIVVVGSMDGIVYGVDSNSGWPLWRMRSRRPIVSSPLIHDETVYIGSSDGSLYAINLFSGKKQWEFETNAQITSSPAYWNDAIYFGATDNNVYSIDTKKGRLRWKYETGGFIVSSPVVHDGVVYIGSSDHHLYALPA